MVSRQPSAVSYQWSVVSRQGTGNREKEQSVTGRDESSVPHPYPARSNCPPNPFPRLLSGADRPKAVGRTAGPSGGLGILAQYPFRKMYALIPVIPYFRSLLLLPAARVVLPGLLLVALSALGYAQQPLSLADADLRGSVIFQQSGATGMVLVVVRNNEVMLRGYGETYPGSGVRPAQNSLIRLCSISKVFTGELLLELANEGKVRLDDPLQRYAPLHRIVPQGLTEPPSPCRNWLLTPADCRARSVPIPARRRTSRFRIGHFAGRGYPARNSSSAPARQPSIPMWALIFLAMRWRRRRMNPTPSL